jgi:hypothetical protein
MPEFIQRSPQGGAGDNATSFEARAGKGGENDASIEIRATPLEAVVNLRPPRGDGALLTLDLVQEAFEHVGIASEAVDWGALQDKLLESNLNRNPVLGFVAAKGLPPVPEVPEHLVILEPFAQGAKRDFDDKATIDYRAESPFLTVRKGEAIAKLERKIEGKTGRDIYGKEIAAPKTEVEQVEIGEGCAMSGDQLIATRDGQVLRKGPLVTVEEVLVVKAVDYHTGNIVFPGDCYIDGEIKDDFKVFVGGNLHVKGTMDAFEVNCHKNLAVAGGIIGRMPGHVRVGGDLEAKFIQTSRVAVRGDIRVSSAIVSSMVYTLGRIEMGDKGRIVGGDIYSAHGIKCNSLGSEAMARTSVHCGIDFLMKQRLDQSNEKLRQYTLKLQKIEQAMALKPSARLEALHSSVREMIAGLQTSIGELLGSVEIDDGAMVEVAGTAWPGTSIEICHVRLDVTSPIKRAKIRLDKAKGVIVVDKFAEGQ